MRNGTWPSKAKGSSRWTITGEKLLTRAGNFQVNAQGELLTQQGFKVLDVEGTPIVMNPSMYSKIHKDGFVQHSGGGQDLGIVKPQSLGDLAASATTRFAPWGPWRRSRRINAP